MDAGDRHIDTRAPRLLLFDSKAIRKKKKKRQERFLFVHDGQDASYKDLENNASMALAT